MAVTLEGIRNYPRTGAHCLAQVLDWHGWDVPAARDAVQHRLDVARDEERALEHRLSQIRSAIADSEAMLPDLRRLADEDEGAVMVSGHPQQHKEGR